MDFLIGNITPNDPNEAIPNDGVVTPESPKPGESFEDPPKKTNWILYGLLGIIALSLIMQNKK